MGLTHLGTKAVAFMYRGQWVAQCPTDGCGNVEKRGVCDDGTTGGLEAFRFHCRIEYGGCGQTRPVEWPADITELATLLLARPLLNRNWVPGEGLADIAIENVAHGIGSRMIEAG